MRNKKSKGYRSLLTIDLGVGMLVTSTGFGLDYEEEYSESTVVVRCTVKCRTHSED